MRKGIGAFRPAEALLHDEHVKEAIFVNADPFASMPLHIIVLDEHL